MKIENESMTGIDADMLERVIEQTRSQPWSMPARLRTSNALLDNRKQIEQLLEAYVQKADLPLKQIEHLKAERRDEQRRLLDQAAEDEIEWAQWTESERTEGLRMWREARSLLSPQTQATIIRLDEPFQISLLTHSQPVEFSSHIEPLNNFARLRIDTHSGSDSMRAVFFFLWQNPNTSIAVINALTLLRFNGVCQVEADSGFFSGNENFLNVTAGFDLFRWSGWGTDANGNPLDGTRLPVFMGNTFQNVSSLDVTGGGLFDPPEIKRDTLRGRPAGLDAELIIVPGDASILFQVILGVSYRMDEDADGPPDEVLIDFARDAFHRRVTCPSLKIELLT
jgi:hypothetical protein